MSATEKVEPASTTWRVVKAYAQTRLIEARGALEDPASDAMKTAALRSQITELKLLLALGESAPDLPASSAPY